jgi:hypothetical protein
MVSQSNQYFHPGIVRQISRRSGCTGRRIGLTRLMVASLAELSRYVVKATVPLEECNVLR